MMIKEPYKREVIKGYIGNLDCEVLLPYFSHVMVFCRQDEGEKKGKE